MKFLHSLFFGSVLLLLFVLSAAATPVVVAAESCVIPDKGPWPPCATGGGSAAQPAGKLVNATNTAWVIHQGRGAKQSPIVVNGLSESARITRIEVTVDFTYSSAACSLSPQAVDLAVLGYSIISPSGKQVYLIHPGDLSGSQAGTRAKMRFTDSGAKLNQIASGTFQSADSLSQLNGENPSGEWKVVITKRSFIHAVCQHSATLHITTSAE
jgi:subtilisin-like proprotein convertase family protein